MSAALKQPPLPSGPGPFRADQIREGDPYELSNGHPIRCMGAGGRHGRSNTQGAQVINTDPGLEEPAGVDVGFEFNQGKNLRAPDIAAGNLQDKPGWAQGVPPLAVEYADRGQDTAELGKKIEELLTAGTRYIWVVRLVGPLRVEVHERGKPMRVVDADGVLSAPGVLQNPVPVRALVDRDAANEAALTNLLNRKGYGSLDAVRQEGLDEGTLGGLRQAVLDLCEVLHIEVTEARARHIESADAEGLNALRSALKQGRSWPA